MTTSGASVFNLDLNNIFEEAFERCGKELRTGYEFRTSRRSLNLLTIEWANRGINLWTIEQGAIPLVTGQAIYPVPVDTIQLLDTVIRQNNATTNQTDINISNISEPTFSSIPKNIRKYPDSTGLKTMITCFSRAPPGDTAKFSFMITTSPITASTCPTSACSKNR